MSRIKLWPVLTLGMLLGSAGGAGALPGQTADEVASWIQAHPTLQPAVNETLTVRKSDTAAQRFLFEASVLPAGKLAGTANPGFIRTERLELFDIINGVSAERLVESLRVIYGVGVYQDYQRGRVIYSYPSVAEVAGSGSENAPLLQARKGELRAGERYAYWIEVLQPPGGNAVTGQLVILLKSDLDDLEAYLRSR